MSDVNFRSFVPGITLVPQSTSNVSAQGDMDVDTASGKINYNNGTNSSHIVTETQASEGASRLQNKDLDASNVQIVDPTDTTKKLNFQASGAATATILTLADIQTTSQTLTIPNVSSGDSLVTNNTVATLTNKIISFSSNTFTGTLPIANGGTNANSAPSAYNNLSPMTTTGDIEYEASAGVAARLGIGSSGQVLTVSGGVPVWAPASGGFTNPMTTLGDVIIGGASGTATRLGIGSSGQVLTVVSGSPAWQSVSSPLTVGTYDSQTPSANALTIASNVLYAQSASASNPGMISTGSQTIAGSKTFNSMISSPGINMAQISTPSNPASGFNDVYFKSDGNLYILNSSGVETELITSIAANPFFIANSTQVTTDDSGVTSSTFTTISTSPAFTFTPVLTGAYKVYANTPLNASGTDPYAVSRIFNTSGGVSNVVASQQTTNNTETSFSTADWFGQSFIPTVSGPIGSVHLTLSSSPSSLSGTMAVQLYSDNAGQPGTLLATSATINGSTLITSDELFTFTFTSGPTLSLSTTYWVVLNTSNLVYGGSTLSLRGVTPNPYASGNVTETTNSGSTWTSTPSECLKFQVLITTSTLSVLITETQGATFTNNTNTVTTVYAESIYTLTGGVSYQFDIQTKVLFATGTVEVVGSQIPYYMMAQRVF